MKHSAFLVLMSIALVFSSAFIVMTVSDNVCADTTITGGHITIDTNWTLANSPYYIEGNVYVDPGVVLTIEPGVVVKFDGYYSLMSNGTINATGNSINRITFTSNRTTPTPKDWYGIVARDNGTVNLAYCNITYANVGVFLDGDFADILQYSNITNTYIAFCDWYGIYFEDSNNNSIMNNTFYQNNNCNVVFMRSHWNNVSNNNASHTRMGIALSFSSNNNMVFNNNLSYHWGEGIDIDGDNNTILNTHLWSNNYGITSWFGGFGNVHHNNTILNTTITGFHLTGNNTADTTNSVNYHPVFYYYDLKDQTINVPERAGNIIISDCENLVMNNCHIENADYISIVTSNNIKIQDAIVIGSGWNGIGISSSYENHIVGGNFSDNQYGICQYNYGEPFSNDEQFNRIENCSILNNKIDGIFLRGASKNTFFSNTIKNNSGSGIQIDGSYGPSAKSSGNIFSNNTINLNGANGIYMFSEGDMSAVYYHTNNNSFIANNISMNSQNGIFLEALSGALYSSSYNSFTDNIITSNVENGIKLSSANENVIVSNNISDNSGYGIFLTDSEYNEIYRNSIENNVNQAYDDGSPTWGNTWDNGYPGGGNRWSDYNGTDANYGPAQDVPGSDGIGDLPYTTITGQGIQGGLNQDNYPFMPSNGLFNVTPDLPPVAEAGPDQFVDEGENVVLNGSLSTDDFGIMNYTWTFLDGGAISLSGMINFHIFNTPGIYNVTLNVTDGSGNWDIDICIIYVNASIPNSSPISAVDQISPYWQNTSPTIITATANDSDGTVSRLELYYNYEGGPWIQFGIDFDEPWSWSFNFPAGQGNYEFYSIAVDDDLDNETVPGVADASCGYDATPPISDAGPDQQTNESAIVTFDGSDSFDNVVIVNFTWTFSYNGSEVTLYEISPQFTFWTPGNYSLTLNVTDTAGNWNTDTMFVTVNPIIIEPPSDGGIGEYWWAILIIIAVIVTALLFIIKKPEDDTTSEPPVSETTLCPTCGFEIEAASPCPFCVEETPELLEPEPHPNQEILDKIEKAYQEGKLSEDQYQKNMEKFGKV